MHETDVTALPKCVLTTLPWTSEVGDWLVAWVLITGHLVINQRKKKFINDMPSNLSVNFRLLGRHL